MEELPLSDVDIDNISIERISKLYRFIIYPELIDNSFPNDLELVKYIKKEYPEILIHGFDNLQENICKYFINILKKNKHYSASLFRAVFNKSAAGFIISNEMEEWVLKSIEILAINSTDKIPNFPLKHWLNSGGFSGLKPIKKQTSYPTYNQKYNQRNIKEDLYDNYHY